MDEANSILKVNHAGEIGAIEIYKTQLAIARFRCRELVAFLTETLGHEKQHRNIFREMMRPRGGYPCRAAFFWARGGCALGIITALLGRKAILACTAAVEGTVHHHMQDQINYLAGRDEELRNYIVHVLAEETGHQEYAEKHLGDKDWLTAIIFKVVVVLVEIIIWLSTWGGVQRLNRRLCEAK